MLSFGHLLKRKILDRDEGGKDKHAHPEIVLTDK